MPLSRMRSACRLWKTSMVSPSRMETTGPVKLAAPAESMERENAKVNSEKILPA